MPKFLLKALAPGTKRGVRYVYKKSQLGGNAPMLHSEKLGFGDRRLKVGSSAWHRAYSRYNKAVGRDRNRGLR